MVPKPEAGSTRREVILIDRRHDKHLATMHKEAGDAVARARFHSSGSSGGGSTAGATDAAPPLSPRSPRSPGSPGSPRGGGRGADRGKDSLACFQALAHVVAGHLGGTLVRRAVSLACSRCCCQAAAAAGAAGRR